MARAAGNADDYLISGFSMSQSLATAVFIPIVNNDGSVQRFLEVAATASPPTKHQQDKALDTSIAELQDYGYYPAGKTAQTAFQQLMQAWREHAPLPTWVTAKAKNSYLQVLSKLSQSMAYDSASSELGLLLAMLQQQKRLPHTRIYATGSLLIDETKLPQVTPIDSLTAKTNAIIQHLQQHPPAAGQRVLIAFPKRAYEQAFDEHKNSTQKLVGRRLDAFVQAHPHLNIDILYCQDLPQDLQQLYPHIGRYRRLQAWVWSLPLWVLAGLFAWQLQQPLSIQWEAQAVYPQVSEALAATPQRATLNADGQFMILPPCPTSDIGNIVLQQDDILLMTTSVSDNSWFRGRWFSPPVVVLVGAQSDIRVEAMNKQAPSSKTLGKPVYNLAFSMEPPHEAYAVIAVTQRGFAIDKGNLNKKLNDLTQNMTGIGKITTVSGYLQKHYATADFRFLLKSAQQCQLSGKTAP